MTKVNDKAPDFKLQSDDGEYFHLSEHVGERLLLVFYPGDNTICRDIQYHAITPLIPLQYRFTVDFQAGVHPSNVSVKSRRTVVTRAARV